MHPQGHAFILALLMACNMWWDTGENFLEVAYRLRRRRAVPIGSDAVIEALFNGR
jgi:hypothetical protein